MRVNISVLSLYGLFLTTLFSIVNAATFLSKSTTPSRNPLRSSSLIIPPIIARHHQVPQLSLRLSSSSAQQQTEAGTPIDTANMPKYWNRETSSQKSYSKEKQTVRHAKIISLSNEEDADKALNEGTMLPKEAEVVAVGIDFDLEEIKKLKPNVVFVSHPKAKEPLAKLLEEVPSIEWIQTRSAGIDFVHSPTLARSPSSIQMTNAKGCYSSTLAEYTMMACSYFAKDLPRLMKQKGQKNWEKYSVEEIRGKTMGIIGYGDIGRACARLAKAYGMEVITLRRQKPDSSSSNDNDPYSDVTYYNDGQNRDSLHEVMKQSDYVLVSTPLTSETKGLVDAEALSYMSENAVIVNVGRGPIIDEVALIEVLRDCKIRGAALDVVEIEPLPIESELWELENVLISPHNMDQTDTFQHEATDFFLSENLPRFLRGEELLNIVDKNAGY